MTKPLPKAVGDRCTQIADQVVPKCRTEGKSYCCTGVIAKRWQAAWDGACLALGYDPDEARLVMLQRKTRDPTELLATRALTTGRLENTRTRTRNKKRSHA